MIRRTRSQNPIAEYEITTPDGVFRLRPSEVCALAESLEQWFASHRDQLVEDLADERIASTRRSRRQPTWPGHLAPSMH